MRSRVSIAVAFGFGVLIACAGGGSSSSSSTNPPSGLAYSVNPAVYAVGAPISANTPSSTGGAVVSYSVSPALPAGISLNPSSGVISGTPTAVTPLATYAVTGANSAGSATVRLAITVSAVVLPPSGLTYSVNPAVYTVGTPIAANPPSSTGGAVASYSVSPALPPNLTLNTSTGAITGTPAAVTDAATYTVTASNSAGSTTTDLMISVNAAVLPPVGLTYSVNPVVYTVGNRIAANTPSSSGGAVESYSVSPPLPLGLTLNTSTGVLSGTPTIVAPPATYTVTATNSAGSATVGLNISVDAAVVAPSSLAYLVNPAVYTVGIPIVANTANSSGGTVASYSVSPALPSGLSLNTSTGVISGTPTVVTTMATYTVTATNSAGSTTAGLVVTVNAAVIPPTGLYYSANPAVYTAGTSIAPNTASSSGGSVVSYSVSPALPSGLSLNTSTGVISGTPTAVRAMATYTVTATNAAGSTTVGLSITVSAPLAPALLAEPMDQLVLLGQTATFRVSASGTGPLAYQWHRDGAPITGATSAQYSLSSVALTDGGSTFRVVVSDAYGSSVASNAATLAVRGLIATGSMSIPRYYHTATRLQDGRVLIVGGYFGDNTAGLRSAEIYDPATGAFTPTGSMNLARASHSATLLQDGKVLIVGGSAGSFPTIANAEVYDPATGVFSDAGTLTTGRWGHTATRLPDGRVLVVGGYNGTFLSSAEVYDIDSGSFSAAGNMTTPRSEHVATLLADGNILVAGGLVGFGSPRLASAEIWDQHLGTFYVTGSMLTGRARHTATPLADGRTLITGGESSADYASLLSSTELYDSNTGIFSSGRSMSVTRHRHDATIVATGEVLVSGGRTGPYDNIPVASCELFDSSQGTFTAAGTLLTPRYSHTATLLLGGDVLITGGVATSAAGSYPRSAEIWSTVR